MKKTILIALFSLSLASCRKCYQCTTMVSITGQGTSVGKSEFCGTQRQKQEHEKAGTTTITSQSGSVTITQNTRVVCN